VIDPSEDCKESLCSLKGRAFLGQLFYHQFLKRDH